MRSDLGAAAPRVSVLSVTELNHRLRASLESEFCDVWVTGEISSLRIPASGHSYFCLKDRRSQIPAVMFRSVGQVLKFRPENGLEVIVRGRASLYEVRGDLQLYVQSMEPCGLGAMQLALEQLKRRLAAEGLFDAARKRPLPFWPSAVGVVTALRGAAVHDVVTMLRSRLPQVRIVVRPVRVQGSGAGADIAAAIADLNRCADIGVIIVGRGGGSLEDLWAFNEERVARAIVESRVPTVSAVGHEIDVTIADLVADRRAATPTAAAALVVPDRCELLVQVGRVQQRLVMSMRGRLARETQRVANLKRHLRDPRQALRLQSLRVAELNERLRRAMQSTVKMAAQRINGRAQRLQALSPLAVLQRGYAIVQRADGEEVIRSAAAVQRDEQLTVRFGSGWARVRVEDLGE